MKTQTIELEFSPEFVALAERMKAMPFQLTRAIAQGMDEAREPVTSKIQETRLTGEGPFPVDEHRLGQVSGDLRQSVYSTAASIESSSVITRIGSPLRYASTHEWGFNGQVWVGGFSRKNARGDVYEKVARVSKKTGKGYKAKVKVASGVSQVKAHSRWLSLPARAPFGHGIADQLPIFSRAIERRVSEAFTGGAQS